MFGYTQRGTRFFLGPDVSLIDHHCDCAVNGALTALLGTILLPDYNVSLLFSVILYVTSLKPES